MSTKQLITAKQIEAAKAPQLKELCQALCDEVTQLRQQVKDYELQNESITALNEKIQKVQQLAETNAEFNEKLSENDNIRATVVDALKDENAMLRRRVLLNERCTDANSQYLRRRQLEITTEKGKFTNGDHLKETIAKILSKTTVEVDKADIDICHLMTYHKGKPNERSVVIMEMYERTLRYRLIANRKNLKGVNDAKYGKIYINESLCPQFRKLDYLCRQLKTRKGGNLIHSTWFFNGRLYIKRTEDAARGLLIGHVQDLYDEFGLEVIEALYVRD